MKILGINFSNDSAAAMAEDGTITAASQEERFSRIKHDRSFPSRAVDFCLNEAGISLHEADAVAFFWNPGIHARAATARMTTVPRHPLEFLYSVPTHLMARMPPGDVAGVDQIIRMESGEELRIHFLPHHLCHAAAAFYTSPYDEAAVITLDGYGERQAAGIFHGRGKELRQVSAVDFPHSVGSLYAAITQYLGFRANSGEGKVMGLSSYGNRGEAGEKIRRVVQLTDDGFELDLRAFEFFHDRPARYNSKLVDLLGPPREPEGELTQRHMDIARGLQDVTEEVILHVAKIAAARTGAKAVAMAGGVALNCVANGKLMDRGIFRDHYFFPAACDAGTSMGAALLAGVSLYGEDRSSIPFSEYLGPRFDDAEIRSALERSAAHHVPIAEPEDLAARMIADGLVIGWFQGRAEFGPRALGNRSILASPIRTDMKDLLNSRVKFREAFRPYAPSVIEEECGTYFSSTIPSPFMLRAYDTLPKKRDVLPAITHVDGSARVQTVSRAQNPRYHELIRRLGEITGVPVVLNTSFNVRGEPIVGTVEDAVRCLFSTGLDALIVGDHLVIKDREKVAGYLE